MSRPARVRAISETDRAIWAQYARLVRPLPGRSIPDAPPPAPPVPPPFIQAPPAPRLAPSRAPLASLATGIQPPGVDNATWSRFRAGKLPAARTLDLHGKTVQAAYHILLKFLHGAHADHLRCVEVITGRGSGESGGAIRREFQLWLNLPTIRPLILGASHPHPQNPGSTRLLLRRPR